MADRRPASLSLVHGARSNVVKRADVRRIERQVAVQNGTRLRDMTGSQRRYLRLYAEAVRIVQRIEPLGPPEQEGGQVITGNMSTWLAGLNSAGRSLERFELAMGSTNKRRDQAAILDDLARYRRPS